MDFTSYNNTAHLETPRGDKVSGRNLLYYYIAKKNSSLENPESLPQGEFGYLSLLGHELTADEKLSFTLVVQITHESLDSLTL